MRSEVVKIAAIVVVCLSAAPLAADSGSYSPEIEVRGDDACIRAESLKFRVQRWLAGRPWDRQTRVIVDVSSALIRIELMRGDRALGEREFDVLPERCAQRLDALGVAIAFALEQSFSDYGDSATAIEALANEASNAAPDHPGPATAAAPPDGPARTSDPEASEKVSARANEPGEPADPELAPGERSHVVLALGGGVVSHQALNPAAVLAAGVEWNHGALSLEGSLRGSTVSVVRLGVGTVRTQFAAWQVRACFQLRLVPVSFFGCAGGVLGVVFAGGREFDPNRDVILPWIAPVLRTGAAVRLMSRVSVRVAVEGTADVIRPEFLARVERAKPDALALGPLGAAGLLDLFYELP